jgi:LuxR family maltose regulon positive regulatory protein
MLVRVYLAAGRIDEATHLIAAAREMARASDLRRRLIELDVLEAAVLAQTGKQSEALAPLGRALESGEPDDYLRVFLDDGDALLPVLRALRRNRPADAAWSMEYLDRIMREIDDTVPEPSPSDRQPASDLVDPLTQREIEVLGLLAEGLTNRQVAERLFLSVGTIKRHTHNIYGKLGVNSRTQAIILGQELRLLD